MRKALYFDHPHDFCEFVKLQGSEAHPQSGSLFEIYRVVHPSQPGQTAMVLFNFKTGLTDRFFGASTRIKGDIATNGKELNWSVDESTPAQIIETIWAKTLVECVDLVPWSEQTATRAGDGPVFFQIEKPELVASLISQSLQLANDRIQFGPVKAGESGGEATILRIEKPSFYLIQQCLEEYSDFVTVFYPEAEDLFVIWGKEHPLRDWWRRSERKRAGQWVFFHSGTDYHHVEPVIWRDAYDLTDLTLDFNHREIYGESPDTPPRFEVKLRLAPKAADTTEPELWLLDETGVQQLENTLQLTDDESLRSWQIAIQKRGGDARDWLFIRELRSSSKHSRHHDFGGTAFARYRGINDLLLPVGYEIQPPLRRDAYRQLFHLEPGYVTLLVPQDDDEAFLILKISERSFESLTSFIEYLVERDSEVMEELVAGSVFNFRHYLKAPQHPGLTPGEKTEGDNRRKSVAGIGEVETPLGPMATEEKRGEEKSLIDRLEKPVAIDESALGAAEKEELRLERKLASDGQSIDIWCDLLVCKNQLGKIEDAVVSAVEALWMANGTSREAGLIDSLRVLAKNSIEKHPSKVTIQDPEWERRGAVFAMALKDPGANEIDQWISETTAFLKLHDAGLRSKERWLAWGQVLRRNQDERRETQLREEIRERITREGLTLEETPPFVRSRIFLDRRIGADDDESSQTAVQAAVGNLDTLHAITKTFKADRLRIASQAVLARAFSNIGDLDRAQKLIIDKVRSEDPCARAWESMFQIEALRGIDQSRAHALEDELEVILVETDADTTREITQMRETYHERAEEDNPAAFLARENRGRTYPHGPRTESGQLHVLMTQLEEQVTAGNEGGAVGVMRTMMTLDDHQEYDDHVKLPQFVETLVGGLERFKWGERGSSLMALYESFADHAPDYVTMGENSFYGSILHSNLALGLLVFEHVEKATDQIKKAHELVSDPGTTDLDFIDSAAALIRTIEQLPLDHRRAILRSLMETFKSRFDKANCPYLSNERLFATLAKLLDQMAEAASSKDQLSLQQFRSYQLQDEFLILQRIQSESFLGG